MVEILRFGIARLLGCVGVLAVSIHPTFAQLTPDNTLGMERSVVIPINKDNDRIGGGAARGINLFHSFQDFNVGVGRGVYFANPEGITNIFSRVTGGNSSNIFGKLGVDGAANLFLLNPNGIVFGKNASLDVQGSFLGTTANSLIFPNGVEFSATNPQGLPLLSINVPIGLQFGSQPGSITNQAVNALSVGSGSTLALIGGEIALDGSSLSTENGQMKLGAVVGDTTVGLNVNGSSLGFKLPENFGQAPINLTNAKIFATGENSGIELFGGKMILNGSSLFGNNSGSIVVDATQFNLDNGSTILSATSGAGKGGDIQIQASDAVTLANGSSIYSRSNADATGAGGNVTINGGKITIAGDGIVENSGKISTFSFGKGNGGNLTLNATESVNANGGLIGVSSGGAGNGGNLTVRATDAVNITNRSSIYSFSNAAGGGGDVTINAGKITITGDRTVKNSGKIGTFSYAEGNGGNLTFNATESVNVNGGFTGVYASGVGNAGNLTVRATDAVNITNQGNLTLFSSSSGSTGNLRIETGTLRVQNNFSGGMTALASGGGSVGSISIQAGNAVEVTQGNIFTGGTTATAGDITIETQRLNLKDGSDIRTSTYSNANAANIFIKASEYVDISGNSYLSSDTYLGSGNGGNVTIETPRLSLTQGGHISTTSTESSGNAGNITIRAKDVELDGFVFVPKEELPTLDFPFAEEILSRFGGLFFRSDFSSDVMGSNADARGGRITIDTERLQLTNGGNISTSVLFGRGQGGNLVVHATDSIDITGVGPRLLNGSFAPSGLFAELQTGGIGSGGSIDVTTGRLNLSNGGEISAATFNQGNAGNITINANQIDLHGSDNELFTGITSSVQEGANGKGGDIDITSNNLDIRDNTKISSGSIGTGDAGDIRINANFLEILGKGSTIASSTNAGNGGNISLDIADLLLLRGGGFISTTAGRNEAGGNGGNININSKFIVAIPKENSDISANAYTGSGGKVQINSQGIFGIEARTKPTEKSDITASSKLGISGITNINAPDTSYIQNSFTRLSPNLIDTNALIANSCISHSPNKEGTFFITGSGGLRNSPNDASISIYSTGEVRSVNDNTSHTWKKGERIIEPTGAYRLADGRLILSRECQ